MLRKIGSIVLVSGIVLAALLAPFAGIERSNHPPSINAILFQPSKASVGDWDPDGLRYKDVQFRSLDGTLLHGWVCDCPSEQGSLLLIHGNAGNVATRTEMLRRLQVDLRLDVFVFDYRGYGRSHGRPSIDGAYLDTKAALTECCEQLSIEANQVILLGESLGGAYAIQLAVESNPRALILQSTFSSLRDLAKVHYPQHAAAVSNQTLNSAARIKKYSGPLLQVHGSKDEIVPISLARNLNQSYAGQMNVFHEHTEAGHNDLLSADYLEQIGKFVRDLDDGGY